MNIYIILILVLSIAALTAYYYLFNIYEVTFSVSPKELYADNTSTCTIETVPLNALGRKALFRTAATKFKIEEGKDLVEIILNDEENGKLIIKAKNRTGKVTVFIKSKLALLPSSVQIPIYPNFAFDNNIND